MALINSKEFKRVRKVLGHTQPAMAKILGVHKNSISNYENGKREIPTEISDKVRKLENEFLAKEQGKETIKTYIIEEMRELRHQQPFICSDIPSIDMIVLRKTLDGNTVRLFEQHMNAYAEDARVTFYDKGGNGKDKGFKRWRIDGVDCVIHVGYGYINSPSMVKVQFNPNKAHMESNEDLIQLIRLLGYYPEIVYLDVCKDIRGLKVSEILQITNDRGINHDHKTADAKKGGGETHYLGDKNYKSNTTCTNLMIYDKRKEKIASEGKDIGHELTRLEIRYRPNQCNLLNFWTSDIKVDIPTVAYITNASILQEEGQFNLYEIDSAVDILAGRKDMDRYVNSRSDADRHHAYRVDELVNSIKVQRESFDAVDIRQAMARFYMRYLKVFEGAYVSDKEVAILSTLMTGADGKASRINNLGGVLDGKLQDQLVKNIVSRPQL